MITIIKDRFVEKYANQVISNKISASINNILADYDEKNDIKVYWEYTGIIVSFGSENGSFSKEISIQEMQLAKKINIENFTEMQYIYDNTLSGGKYVEKF